MTNLRQFPTINTNNLAKILVGFDDMFSTMESRFGNQLQSNYPPHNIIKVNDNQYAIQMAVAGFKKNEISVEVKDDVLTITSHQSNNHDDLDYIHRGLSFRSFERSFKLAEHVLVQNASISDGILTIQLEKVIPEEKKPKLIEITEL